MLSKSISVILFVALILGILIFHGANYENPSVAFAQGSGAQPVAQVPINVTNTQSVALPSPFQLMIKIDSAEYAAYEAADLSNVAFAYSNGTVIPSWLESGNSNSSTDTVYWLKVCSVSANSSATVFMNFYPITDNVLNDETTGEAPDLSTPRGQYDDGPTVFTVYGDFMNGLSGWQVSAYQGSFMPVSSSNGVEMVDGNVGELTYLTPPMNLPSTPMEIIEAWNYDGGYNSHALSIGPSPFTTSNTVISGDGYSPVLNNSVSATFDFMGESTELYDYAANKAVSGSSSFTGDGSFNVVSFLTLNGTWASTGFTSQYASLENFSSVLIPTVVSGYCQHTLSNQALIIGAANHAYSVIIGYGPPSIQYIRWVIGRAFPPNGVAPTVTIGKVEAVPEFPSFVILPIFMIATLIAVMISKKKRKVAHVISPSLQKSQDCLSFGRLLIDPVQE
jgi:hypothetical protein